MVAQTHVSMPGRTDRRDTLLGRALIGNALFSLVTGVAMIAGSSRVSDFTGLGPAWLPAVIGAGVLLWAVDVALIARASELRPKRVWMVIGGDLLWVVASYAILLAGRPELTTAGSWSAGILAEIVALFAVIQFVGLRRLRA